MKAPRPIRVLIADDHPLVVEGLRAVLKKTAPDITVSGAARDGEEALALSKRSPADVYVLDISMPVLNGLETMERLLGTDPEAKVIILSMHDDRPIVRKALRSGARGYLLKESAAGEIARAVRQVYRGERYLSPAVAALLREPRPPAAPLKGAGTGRTLTAKEKDVVRLIAEGLGNKQIAGRLSISEHTVHVHRRNITRKLDIHKQTELVRYAIREGLEQP